MSRFRCREVIAGESLHIAGVKIVYPANVHFRGLRLEQRIFVIDGRYYRLSASGDRELWFFSFLKAGQEICG